MDRKTLAIISYLSIIGWLIAFSSTKTVSVIRLCRTI